LEWEVDYCFCVYCANNTYIQAGAGAPAPAPTQQNKYHNGEEDVKYHTDSYYVSTWGLSKEDAEKCRDDLIKEAFVLMEHGRARVDPDKEMQLKDVVYKQFSYKAHHSAVQKGKKKVGDPRGHKVAESGEAIWSDDTTFFHSKEGSYTRDRTGEYKVMPHRHTHFGEEGVDLSKSFSNNPTRMFAKEMNPMLPFSRSPTVQFIREKVEEHIEKPEGWLNYCNMNLYFNGDKLGKHRDPYTDNGTGYVVWTVSLGDDGDYSVVKDDETGKTTICVKSGSLNALGVDTNKECKHEMKPLKGGYRIHLMPSVIVSLLYTAFSCEKHLKPSRPW
jgi:hypothetical protein